MVVMMMVVGMTLVLVVVVVVGVVQGVTFAAFVDRFVVLRMSAGRRRRRHVTCRQVMDLVPKDSADGTDRRDVELVTDGVSEQPFPDLPGEDARVLVLVGADGVDDARRRHPRLASADRSRKDRPGVVVAGEDLADAAVRNLQLTGDVARTDPVLGQLHDPQSDGVGERSTVDEDAPQLVYFAVRQQLRTL